MEYKIYSTITCPSRRCYGKCKTSRILKIDVFEVPDKLKIMKNCSQNMNCLIQQANSSYDPSKILILQFPMPADFLPPLPSLSNLTLANWNLSLTQS